MRASHEHIIVTVEAEGIRTPRVVPSGATLQDLLNDSLGLPVADVEVTVNGRSVSRLQPLLPGDRVAVRPGQGRIAR